MEKYSKWRDPGTGIQPFLTPIPPLAETSVLAKGFTLVRYALAVLKTVPVLLCSTLYLLTVEGVLGILKLAQLHHLQRPLATIFTSIWTRLILLMLGALRFDVKYSASSSRGKSDIKNIWKPKAGDVIVSNWISWIELLWLAYRFNPIFLLPTPTPATTTSSSSKASLVQAFSLPSLVLRTGQTPPSPSSRSTTFAEAQKKAKDQGRVLVLLPEGTTTNGRGVAKFVDVFGEDDKVERGRRRWGVWLVCFRYPTPTPLSPTLTHSLTSPSGIPILPHLFSILTSFPPTLPLAISLLSPADCPLSTADNLTERCVKGISEMGRLKRVGFGWEDKKAFLEVLNAPAGAGKAGTKAKRG